MRIRSGFGSILLVSLLTLTPVGSASAQDECGLEELTSPGYPSGMFSNLHEELTKYKQEDRRSVELQNRLTKGIKCLDNRMVEIRELARSVNTKLDTIHSSAGSIFTASLQPIATTLKEIEDKLPVTDHNRPVTGRPALDPRAVDTLLTIQKSERDLIAQLDQNLSNPAARATITLSTGNTFNENFGTDTTHREVPASDQFDPREPILNHYHGSDVSIEIAIATVPDPRVPRHRRQYDDAITAMNQGMLRSGFVLDLYSFPWRKELAGDGPGPITASSDKPHVSSSNFEEDDGFGLMLYRWDRWRGEGRKPSAGTGVSIRAVYVVPETGTYGVQPLALRRSLELINGQLATNQPVAGYHVNLATHPACSDANPELPVAPKLVIFGPMFSGSVDSIREGVSNYASGLHNIAAICMVSESATAATNAGMLDYGGKTDDGSGTTKFLTYNTLATDDDTKIKFIADLARSISIAPERVALVYEATVFGDQVCKNITKSEEFLGTNERTLCEKAVKVAFPVNIADVRYSLRKKELERKQEKDKEKKDSNAVFRAPDHLALQEGAENGSEFPESQQSPLTAASTELVLDHVIEAARQKDPQLVVIVATDVRDRLFLMQKIGSRLTNALFVDLGADRLLAHPDFIDATRGAISMATTPLSFGNCRPIFDKNCREMRTIDQHHSVWSTDEQAQLFRLIANWPGGSPESAGNAMLNARCSPASVGRKLCPHLVTRAGLYSSLDFDEDSSHIVFVVVVLLLFLVAVAAFFYYYGSPQGSLQNQGAGLNAATFVFVGIVVVIAGLLSLWTGGGAVMFVLGVALASLTFWPVMTGCRWPFITCWMSSMLLLATLVIEVVYALQWLRTGPTDDAMIQLAPLLDSLAMSPGAGLAYPLAVAVACLTLVICIWISLTCARALTRSDNALQLATPAASPFGVGVIEICTAVNRAGAALLVLGSIFFFLEMVIFWSVGGHRVTAFGIVADFSAFVAIVATTILAFGMLAGAIGMGNRIQILSGLMRNRVFAMHGLDLADEEKDVLVWGNRAGPCPQFASTPVFATANGAGSWIVASKTTGNYVSDVNAALTLPAAGRIELGAVYAVFTDEMFIYRLAVIGLIACTLSASAIVYLFPVSHATTLIAINMALLVVGGVVSAYYTVSFEGDLILSSLLCNRKREREWTWPMFGAILLPFVVLAIIVGVVQIPGVADAGGSVLDKILGVMKLGGK